MRRIAMLGWVVIAGALAVPSAAFGHAERKSYYPNFDPEAKSFMPAFGQVPNYRASGGRRLVVCKKDSVARIRRTQRGATRRRNLALAKKCKFRHIQTAVNKARSNTRIFVMPGIYKEEPTRDMPDENPKCAGLIEKSYNGTDVKSYEYQRLCPEADNLIAIMGDGPDSDRRCDLRCNIQIVGRGVKPTDVRIQGERSKLNIIRADRADGVYLANFYLEFSDFNNVYILETNGFRMNKLVSAYSREYGFLSFSADQGLYENLEAYGSGDSGIYPGSGPEGRCQRYGIEIRFSDSHHNNLGTSGTAGNGTWYHDNKFHHNGTGSVVDSFAAGHPGMPQDCSKWENNEIYSNNLDLFNAERDAYCKQPYEQRDPKVLCSTFQNPVGTGILIAGGNHNIIANNRIWDNWRHGVRLLGVPRDFRGDDPTGQSVNSDADQFDNSKGNKFTDNFMGIAPDGSRDPNGLDFHWDEGGVGNCWQGNKVSNRGLKSDPAGLPTCSSGGSMVPTPNAIKLLSIEPCGRWNPQTNTDPAGCDWFVLPPEPK